jgi:hypothetical protein
MNALAWLVVLGFFVLSLAAALVTTVVAWVKRRRCPRPYGLLIVTVLLFSCLGYFLLFMPVKFAQVKPVGGALYVKETAVADLAIQTLVSVPADTDQPVQVLVDFTSPPSPSQPTPVGTPGVPVAKAFGSGYDFFVQAQLNASAFDVVPQEQPVRAFDQPGTFTWALTPRYTGYQSVEVIVTGRWIPRSGGPAIEHQLARQSFSFEVAATPSPSFSLRRLAVTQPLMTLFVALLSLALNVPWIIELLKKRPETKSESRLANKQQGRS